MTKLSTSTSSISSSSSVGPHTQTPEAAQEVNGHLNETLGQPVPSGVVSEPLKPGLAPGQLLHGLLGADPRAAAAAPARVVVHIDLQAEPLRLATEVFKQLHP